VHRPAAHEVDFLPPGNMPAAQSFRPMLCPTDIWVDKLRLFLSGDNDYNS